MAVFSPQSKAPKESYLDELRSYLCGKAELRPLLDGIDQLPQIWAIFARHNSSIAELTQGARYTQALSDWVIKGNSSSISNVMSGILSLPLLTIIQVVQYFQFLEVKRLRHCDFMHRLRDRGGIQGYCGGLMPAIAIACKYCLVSSSLSETHPEEFCKTRKLWFIEATFISPNSPYSGSANFAFPQALRTNPKLLPTLLRQCPLPWALGLTASLGTMKTKLALPQLWCALNTKGKGKIS